MMRRLAYLATAATVLTACNLAPDYHRPAMTLPANYKESAGNWLPANPKAADTDRGPWWHMYHDAELDTLEDQVTSANQDLKAAAARYAEARADAAVARAAYFPTLTAGPTVTREKYSKTVADAPGNSKYNDYLVGGDLSWEIDVWDRVRNAAAAGKSRAQASAADMAAMDLSLHAELATDYFALRGQDAAQVIVDQTVEAYQKAYDLTKARHEGGASPEADVDQAQAQLETAKTLSADTRLKRTQLEHAIAVLVGQTPSGFSIAAKKEDLPVPPVTPGIPSTLLEQRPDIAASELRVQAANADIGVARAAFFPDFTLSAEGGFESAFLPMLLKAPSLFWSVGPSAVQTVFDGGKISALSDRAHAQYDESVADYRQTVLIAFRQVEDNLSALRELKREETTEAAAVAAAERALTQAQDRYKGGIATYLDVVVEQNMALQAELSAVDIRTRHLTANVLLVEALGGGWHDAVKAPESTVAELKPTH